LPRRDAIPKFNKARIKLAGNLLDFDLDKGEIPETLSVKSIGTDFIAQPGHIPDTTLRLWIETRHLQFESISPGQTYQSWTAGT